MSFSKSIHAQSLSKSNLSRLGLLAFWALSTILSTAAHAQVSIASAGTKIEAAAEVPAMRFVPGMEEPLVATGPVTEQENKDLDAAISAFRDAPAKAGPSGDFDDYAQPLLAFIAAHPDSNWDTALYTDIGFGYYRAGYYSRVFIYLGKAWQLGRRATSPQARLMVDRAVGELARMHARVGHDKELEALFQDIGKRPIGGPATELIQGAHEGQWTFRRKPGEAFLCGPNALKTMLMTLKAAPDQVKVAQDARSGPHGFSLEQLAGLADKAKLDYRLIHREPGQPIPVPSIIHWNINHYAALVARQGALYVVADPTFGASGASVLTTKAINAESSGYFLVPASVVAANSANGWHNLAADAAEAKTIYGMGTISGVTGGCTTCNDITVASSDDDPTDAMTSSRAHVTAVSLNLTDTPIGYKPQKGEPALTTLSYNSREVEQPGNFSFSNVSPKWTHSWLAYIQDDPNNPGINVTRIAPGGGGYDYYYANGYDYNSTTGAFIPETYDNSQLFRYPATGPATSYVRYMPDGSKEVYAQPNGATTAPRYMFLTQRVDPAGNTTTLSYDTQLRLTTVTDAMGRKTTFSYGLSGTTGEQFLITKITDPFGRSTTLTYDNIHRLSSITDRIGIKSTFTYGSTVETNFVTNVTTPYGTSTFSDTENPNDTQYALGRSLTLTDPLGHTDFLYLFQNDNTPASETLLPTGISNDSSLLQWRNTYYWNRHQSALGVTTNANGTPTSENFAYPTIYHWLHFYYNINYEVNQLGSIKKPLEQYRQWINYPGMATDGFYYYSGTLIKPSAMGRVLDDGSTQISTNTYNSLGLPLSATDQVGRTTQYTYAPNNIDLLTVQQLTAAPSTYQTVAILGNYNSAHEPQTYTGADGQAWNYTYNSAGQTLTATDPNKNVTTYKYDSLGRLISVVNANNITAMTFTYDSADRVATRTDSEGYRLKYGYDNLDRVTSVTYPDGTTDLYDYSFQSGILAGKPSLDLRKHTDRLGRITTYEYDADRRLTSVTEPLEEATTRTTSYTYYEDGTLQSITDSNGNVTHWDIDAESRPISKTYGYGSSSAETETYAYEATNSRMHSVTDAQGQIKTFTYGHDNRITGITYTNAVNTTPDVSLTWDQYFPRLISMMDGTGTTNYAYTPIGTLGGLKLSSIAGPYINDTIGLTYDALGRLVGRIIPGGGESFSYDAINRLISHEGPLGTFLYGYLGQTGQIVSRKIANGKITVSTEWGYDTNTNDRRLININNSGLSRNFTLSYLFPGSTTKNNPYDIESINDVAAPGHPFASQEHGYEYDSADRLLSATSISPGNATFAYDSADNIQTEISLSGTTNATYNSLNQLNTWGSRSYEYDANGNTLSDGGAHVYKWDAENRLIQIDYIGLNSKTIFSYDGLGHRTIITEENNKGKRTVTRYLWCGDRICQTRNDSDVVIRRDLGEGEINIQSNQKLVYMQDQLGSIRDVIDATTGARVDSNDFTPYGSISRSNGSTVTDYQYAGLFSHPVSGLGLANYREFDSSNGRWLSKDPLRENAGTNLYSYVTANPVSRTDSLGLGWFIQTAWGIPFSGDTVAQLVSTLEGLGPSSIVSLSIDGHGSPTYQGFNPNNSSDQNGLQLIDGTLVLVNGAQSFPFASLLQGKLDKYAVISLGGCNVARGDNSLASVVSSQLGILTQGCGSFALSNGFCGEGDLPGEQQCLDGVCIDTSSGRPKASLWYSRMQIYWAEIGYELKNWW